ncbi:MAG: hypothetical protein JWM11_6178 [Planctomycetaceae bacterium]|nr:hypothetical protein [Planctomycetaceae bacterium]
MCLSERRGRLSGEFVLVPAVTEVCRCLSVGKDILLRRLTRLTTDYTDITDAESERGCFCFQIRAIREIRGQRDVGLAQFLMNQVVFHDCPPREKCTSVAKLDMLFCYGDFETRHAARGAPMKLLPDLIAAFPPSPNQLLDRIRRDIDDAMLLHIANADYGYQSLEMLPLLRIIRDTGVIPMPINWQLEEVLSLSHWINPDKPEAPPFEPRPIGKPAHQIRLFACAVLLRADAERLSEYRDLSKDSTLALCLASAKALGPDFSSAMASFLTWQLMSSYNEVDPLFSAIGLLIIATRMRTHGITETLIGKIADWILEFEQGTCKTYAWVFSNPRPFAFSLQQGFWQSLAVELNVAANTIQDAEVRTNAQLCALLIQTDWDLSRPTQE